MAYEEKSSFQKIEDKIGTIFFKHLVAISISFILLGIILFFVSNSYPPLGGILGGLAGTLISTGIVSLVFRFFFEESMILKLHKAFEDEFNNLNECKKNLNECKNYFDENKAFAEDIDTIRPSRNRDIILKDAIIKDISDSNRVCLIGVSLRDFFHSSADYNEALTDFLNKENSVILSLIANPFNKEVIKRTLWESGTDFEKVCNKIPGDPSHYFKSKTFMDIEKTLSGISSIITESVDQRKVQLKVYDNGEPRMWLVITDGHAYFQPYAYGRTRDPADLGFCIGQWFFTIGFKNNSRYYNAFQNHFNHLWEDEDNISFEDINEMMNAQNRISNLNQVWRST